MNKKLFFIAGLLILLVIGFLFYFFWKKDAADIKNNPLDVPCLVFQDVDSKEPCFVPPTDIVVSPVASTSVSVTTPTVTMIEKSCAYSVNVFEKEECITSLAKEMKDETLCEYISSNLAQSACERDVKRPETLVVAAVKPPQYETFIEQFLTQSKEPKISTAVTSSNTPDPVPALPSIPTASEVKAIQETFQHKLSFGAPLAVYAASKQQVAPGNSLKIYGTGFAKSGNILFIGDTQTTVDSADGTTLETFAPGVLGEHEIWVTNEKGSSKVADRPILVTVTNSPQPMPVIESASPNPVLANGTVELRGSGFGSTNNLFTSFGNLMNVPSDGTTIRFSISSLQYVAAAAAVPQLRGRIIPIQVNLQTEGGVLEQIFEFNIQF